MKLKNFILLIVFGWICLPVSYGFAGYDRTYDSRQFQYEITGEIQVKPDFALFPVTIATDAKTFDGSLKKAKDVFTGIETDLKQVDPTHFSLSPFDFERSPEQHKMLDAHISFFKREENTSKTQLYFYLRVQFTHDHSFWERAQLLATALDFLTKQIAGFEKDKTLDVHYGEVSLHVEQKEQYREQIIYSMYAKAKKFAEVVAAHEQVIPVIKEIRAGQTIRQEILNINNASLSLDADIIFQFE